MPKPVVSQNLSPRQNPPRYALSQRILHWLSALVVVAMLAMGVAMTKFMGDGPLKDLTYETHKSLGLTLIALTILRLLIRLKKPAPPLPDSIPSAQRLVAHLSHLALYGLMLLVPLLGWAGTSLCCAPVTAFSILPATLALGFEASDNQIAMIFQLHGWAALALLGLVCLHLLAALHHHFVVKDETLLRMWPSLQKREPPPGAKPVKAREPLRDWRPRAMLD